MSGDVLFMLYQLVIHLLNQVCAFIAKLRQMDNGIFYEVEAVNLILDAHIERGSDGAFLQVTVNVHVVVIALKGEFVDQGWVAVECEDNGFKIGRASCRERVSS